MTTDVYRCCRVVVCPPAPAVIDVVWNFVCGGEEVTRSKDTLVIALEEVHGGKGMSLDIAATDGITMGSRSPPMGLLP